MSVDISGNQYGRFTTIGLAKKENGMEFWHVICSCGRKKEIRRSDLLSGRVKSCGCIRLEIRNKRREIIRKTRERLGLPSLNLI